MVSNKNHWKFLQNNCKLHLCINQYKWLNSNRRVRLKLVALFGDWTLWIIWKKKPVTFIC